MHPETQKIIDDLAKKIDAFDPWAIRWEKVKPKEDENLLDLRVTEAKSELVTATGPLSVPLDATVTLSPETKGLVFETERTSMDEQVATIKIIPLGRHTLNTGDIIKSNEQELSIHVGDWMIGRILDPLGNPLDGKEIPKDAMQGESAPLFAPAPTILEREPVTRPLRTGIKAIDAPFPIGRGQRELIIGDSDTGKTALAIDTIIAQKGENVTCVYVAIGHKKQEIARTIKKLEALGALAYTTVIVATSDDTPGLKYIAPYSGMALLEAIMKKGRDGLIIFDDLSLHAEAYREMGDALGFPQALEGYPPDMFAVQSQLLERAAQLKGTAGKHGGSITALPIVTLAGDPTAYIPTNLISITDGQLYVLEQIANDGLWPAIHTGISVSRIGSAAQREVMRNTTKKLKAALADFRILAAFGESSIKDPVSLASYHLGLRIQQLLIQPQYEPLPFSIQAISFFAVFNGFLDKIPVEEIQPTVAKLQQLFEKDHKSFLADIESEKATLHPDDSSSARLKEMLASFVSTIQ